MRKRGKINKKGLSAIVITLIIILISLVAVGIVWVVVRNVIQTGTEGIALGKFTLDARIINVNTDNSSNNVSLTVKRNPGEGEFSKIKFIFYDGKNSEVITEEVSLNQLEERRFTFHLSQLDVSELISISIVPIIKQDEKEIIGNVLDKYTFGSGGGSGIESPGGTTCSPATCSALGYVCGTWNNGTCSGSLSCGVCLSGSCNASGKCVTFYTPNVNPSPLGVNLNTFYYWSTQIPFKNVATQASGFGIQDLTSWKSLPLTLGSFDEDGYPIEVPAGKRIYNYFFLQQGGKYPNGTYVFLYDGKADVSFEWDATSYAKTSEGRYVVQIPSPSDSGVRWIITWTDPNDHIRNIRMVKAEYESNYLAQPYQPEFSDFLEDFSAVRYMDWMASSARFSPRYDFINSATSNTVKLAWGASATDDAYNGRYILVVSNGANQIRDIIDYVGGTRTATVDSAFGIVPTPGDEYFLETGDTTLWEIVKGTSANTVVLGEGSSNINDYYNGMIILAETGWQRRYISGYNGATRVATLSANWSTPPTVGSNYFLYKFPETEWENRAKPSNFVWRSDLKGVPVEIMVDLANKQNVSPWFTLRSEVSDNYVRQFASYVHDNLNPSIKAYIEYSNENWNSGYSGYMWCAAKGEETGIGAWGHSSYRSVQIFKIFDEVFNEPHLHEERNASRLVRVLPCQNAYIENCRVMMDFDGTDLRAGYSNPIDPGKKSADYADVLAIAPYYSSPNEISANDYLIKTEAELISIMEQNIDSHYSTSGSVYTNVQNARARGLDVVTYEVGQEMSLSNRPSGWTDEQYSQAVNKMYSVNRNPLMKDLYLRDLYGWKSLGSNNITHGTQLWVHYFDTGAISRYGCWGLREYMNQSISEAPKWQATKEFVQNNPRWWCETSSC